jgi:predicted nucleotidyltransferase
MTKGGFSEERWRTIARVLSSVAACERIAVFGSRAKGDWREGSDVDLAVWGRGWDLLKAEKARELLEESCFPWSFDVVLPAHVRDRALLAHIERVGFEIPGSYRSGSAL